MPIVELLSSEFTRSGRRFEPVQELAIHDGAVTAVSTLPGSANGVLLIAEMHGPIGIPDFTALVGGRKQLSARRSAHIPPILSVLDASVVTQLHINRPRSSASVAAALSMSAEATASRLRNLVRSGAVLETTSGRFTRNSALSPGGSLYAIEAKVRDWRKAVAQSRRYRVWTNNYVLALGPLSREAQRRAESEVALDEAGLVVNGKWVQKPSRKDVTPLNRLLAFEYFTAALTGHQPSLAMNCSTPDRNGEIH